MKGRNVSDISALMAMAPGVQLSAEEEEEEGGGAEERNEL